MHLVRNPLPEADHQPRRRKMTTRIVGCGNPQRMDDGAGILVARRLRELGICAEIQSGGAFELIADWDREQQVVLIDAVVTGAPAGTVHVWAGNPPCLSRTQHFSSHGFGLAEAFRLAQILNCLPRQIRMYGIEGDQFDVGERISPEVAAAIEQVAQQIAKEFAPAVHEERSVQFAD